MAVTFTAPFMITALLSDTVYGEPIGVTFALAGSPSVLAWLMLDKASPEASDVDTSIETSASVYALVEPYTLVIAELLMVRFFALMVRPPFT